MSAGAPAVAGGGSRIGLLEGALVHRLERMRLRPRVLKTTTARGERLAGKGGASTDFADYRDSVAGDDLRAVDWNAFVRLRRPYLKTFRREEDRHFVILIDASRSMAFEGKLLAAKRLASALAVCAMAATDRVSIWAAGAVAGDRVVAPVRGRGALGRVLAAIASVPDETKGKSLEDAVAAVTARHQGRGSALVISDFLCDAEPRGASSAALARSGSSCSRCRSSRPARSTPTSRATCAWSTARTRPPASTSPPPAACSRSTTRRASGSPPSSRQGAAPPADARSA